MERNASPFPRRTSPRNNITPAAAVPEVDLFEAANACIPLNDVEDQRTGSNTDAEQLHAVPKMQTEEKQGDLVVKSELERPPSTPKKRRRGKKGRKTTSPDKEDRDAKNAPKAGPSSSKPVKNDSKKRKGNHLSALKIAKKARARIHSHELGVNLKEFDSLNSSGQIDEVLSSSERGRLRRDIDLRKKSGPGRVDTKASHVRSFQPTMASQESVQPNFRLLCAEDSTIRRSGGGSGKSSVDPDFEDQLRGVALGDVAPQTMRLRSTSRRQRSIIASMKVIDLTVDDDDDVMSVDAPARMAQSGYLSIPPHMTGPVEVNEHHASQHSYLDPLLDEEEKLVAKLLRVEPDTVKLSTNPSSRITLRGHDFAVLRGIEWLNDEVMNSYVALINDREKRYRISIAEKNCPLNLWRPKSYCFNSFFATRLLGESPKLAYDYNGVSRWTKRAKVDILDLDIVMFPVNVNGNHWVLVVLNIPLKEVYYLDSLQHRDRYKISSFFTEWVRDEIKDKHSLVKAHEFENRKKWDIYRSKYRVHVTPNGEPVKESMRFALIPKQRDKGSCGVFALKMADCISLGIRSYFQSKDISLLRRRMALELYRRVLPG